MSTLVPASARRQKQQLDYRPPEPAPVFTVLEKPTNDTIKFAVSGERKDAVSTARPSPNERLCTVAVAVTEWVLGRPELKVWAAPLRQAVSVPLGTGAGPTQYLYVSASKTSTFGPVRGVFVVKTLPNPEHAEWALADHSHLSLAPDDFAQAKKVLKGAAPGGLVLLLKLTPEIGVGRPHTTVVEMVPETRGEPV